MPDKELLEAFNKTLDTLRTVDLPNAAFILGVFILVAFIVKSIVDWRIVSSRNKGQQQLNQFFVDTFALNAKNQEVERQANRDAFQQSLESILTRLQTGFDNRGHEHADQNTAIATLGDRMKTICTELDCTIESMTKRNALIDENVRTGLAGIQEANKEFKTDMAEIKGGNGEILAELKKLNETMEQIAQDQKHQAQSTTTMAEEQKRQSESIERMASEVQTTMKAFIASIADKSLTDDSE